MTWLPSRSGRPIELVEPRAADVDFHEIAWSLAHLNRYNGHGMVQVSVAHHTLIGLDLAPEALRPWWLLHDAHEWATGDIATPVERALGQVAVALYGPDASGYLRGALAEMKARHDAVIHAAAGLALPTAAQRAEIARIDERCLATEHHKFHAESARPWAHQQGPKPVLPAPTVRGFQPPDRIADLLAQRFERYLPALRGRARL